MTQKYIVCNADEGDPGAYSDMYLMEHQAHKVLFGMYISGKCVGADTGVLYIRGEYPDSIRIVNEAIDKLKEENLIPDFNFKIISGQGSYVCGEETALTKFYRRTSSGSKSSTSLPCPIRIIW